MSVWVSKYVFNKIYERYDKINWMCEHTFLFLTAPFITCVIRSKRPFVLRCTLNKDREPAHTVINEPNTNVNLQTVNHKHAKEWEYDSIQMSSTLTGLPSETQHSKDCIASRYTHRRCEHNHTGRMQNNTNATVLSVKAFFKCWACTRQIQTLSMFLSDSPYKHLYVCLTRRCTWHETDEAVSFCCCHGTHFLINQEKYFQSKYLLCTWVAFTQKTMMNNDM